VTLRVAQQILAALFPNVTAEITFAGDGVTRGVNQNGSQSRIVVSLPMEEEETRLRRDSKANLLREFQACAAFEILFRQEHLHMTQELAPILRRKLAKDGNVVRQDREPLGRDRLST
jgi:hypothetical protein